MSKQIVKKIYEDQNNNNVALTSENNSKLMLPVSKINVFFESRRDSTTEFNIIILKKISVIACHCC